MRSGEAFEVFKDVRRVALDKTGTLTMGKPAVVEVIPLSEADRTQLLRLAASAEQPSEHPLARAVVESAQAEGLDLAAAEDFDATPGQGIVATVEGQRVRVGSLRWLLETSESGVEPSGSVAPGSMALAEAQARLARTVVAVEADGEPLGLIAIADVIKPDAREAVEQLRAAGLEPVMLTGDNWHTARAVAAEVGIEEVLAEVLPSEKAAKVRELQAKGFRVAMVGDGINDAPALMQADVGIAIGAGTDIAIEAADVVLVGERLSAVADAFHIGRSSYRRTVQNLSLAFSFNGIGVPLAVTGLVEPVWAMIAMVASVSTVLLNSFGGRLIPKAAGRRKESVTVRLTVPTMHCKGCLETVERALTQTPDVQSVEGDLESKQVTVTFDRDGINEDDLHRSIQKAGHMVGPCCDTAS